MIISGAQTGVDQAALDFALQHSIKCSGWCPLGRRSENGVIPDKYPVIETNSFVYPVRTRKNIEDSDASIIFSENKLKGGTKLTFDYATKINKPVLCITKKTSYPTRKITNWLNNIKPNILNIAGPRFKYSPRLYNFVIKLLTKTLISNNDNRTIEWPPKHPILMTFYDL